MAGPGEVKVALVGRTAGELSAIVRRGEASPTEVVGAHLDRIAAVDGRVGAFQRLRAEAALAEAEAVGRRPDLGDLPLAGVPVAIKDNIPVRGEPMRHGSAATFAGPQTADHEVVRRLREAGAVVVGITRMPELAIWGATDNAWGITRNPWDLGRTPGGSSGGSAAAVASGMVPVAHASDGMGSIRVPAAACGLVGLKPGPGVIPAAIGRTAWFGMAENGAVATSVADLAVTLSVMADRDDLGALAPVDRRLRVAVSVRSPGAGVPVDREFAAAALETGRLLATRGHRVDEREPPSATRIAAPLLARWAAGVAQDARGLEPARLEPRTRGHVAAGGAARALGLVRPGERRRWRSMVAPLFAEHDVLITPGLAAPPIPAVAWSRRSWAANLAANARFAPFAAPWNLAGYPAMVVPAGRHFSGSPLSVQLVAPEGDESVLLSVGRELEELRPWARHPWEGR